jgi:hypothetical protein
VAHIFLGSSGLEGMDSQYGVHLSLAFGTAIESLIHSLPNFTNWLANNLPPWAAYREIWARRLLLLDNMPGVRPIGIGETW